jgi:hypothetical protein
MQNFITSSHRVIKTLEHKNEEIFEELSPTDTVNKRFWLQTILRKINILEMKWYN